MIGHDHVAPNSEKAALQQQRSEAEARLKQLEAASGQQEAAAPCPTHTGGCGMKGPPNMKTPPGIKLSPSFRSHPTQLT